MSDAMNDVVERCVQAILTSPNTRSYGLERTMSIALSALRPGDELPGGLVVIRKAPTQQMVRAGGEYVLNVGGIDPIHVDDRGPPWNIKGRETGALGLFIAMLAAAKEEG